jgi:hypothetical protein
VQRGNYNAHMQIYDASELGLLQAGFNDMVRDLAERQRLRDLFGRYVGEDVARRALERGTELGGQERDVAVLFVDLVGSTQLASTVPAAEVVNLLNCSSGSSSTPSTSTAGSSTSSRATPRWPSSAPRSSIRTPPVRRWPPPASCTTSWSTCWARPSSASACVRPPRHCRHIGARPASNTP